VRQCRSAASDLPPPFLVSLDKSLNRAVVSPLDISGEETGWQFAQPLVIGQAFAANTFPGAWFIGAVALGFVLFDFAFSHHGSSRKSQLLSSLVESAA
jgi:hypothetical protein